MLILTYNQNKQPLSIDLFVAAVSVADPRQDEGNPSPPHQHTAIFAREKFCHNF